MFVFPYIIRRWDSSISLYANFYKKDVTKSWKIYTVRNMIPGLLSLLISGEPIVFLEMLRYPFYSVCLFIVTTSLPTHDPCRPWRRLILRDSPPPPNEGFVNRIRIIRDYDPYFRDKSSPSGQWSSRSICLSTYGLSYYYSFIPIYTLRHLESPPRDWYPLWVLEIEW